VSKFKEIWADSQESEGNTMSKAEEPSAEWLANECIRQIEEGNYERALFLRCGEALRRLAALEHAAEPVAWCNPNGGFLSDFYMKNFAVGLEKETFTIPLYTHPARKPMTEEDVRKWQGDHDVVMSIKAYRSLLKLVGVERFHDIKE
jgi:hypothetical protein